MRDVHSQFHKKITKQHYLGKHRSIFTAELTAIEKALRFVYESDLTDINILICSDSVSSLQSLQGKNNLTKTRLDIEI